VFQATYPVISTETLVAQTGFGMLC